MSKSLDQSKYVMKSTRVAVATLGELLPISHVYRIKNKFEKDLSFSFELKIQVEIIEYSENSLLSKNPQIVYIKKKWTLEDKTYVDLYDEDDTLLETIISYDIYGMSILTSYSHRFIQK